VTLSVYDVLGRKVATLVDRELSSGAHTITWHGETDGGSQLSSGLYLVRLQAGQEVRTQRVTLVR
jgi:flagellar hook assembly protein FlgD